MNEVMAAVARNWNLIVDVAMWSLSILLVVVLFAKIIKLLKMEFEFQDIFGFVFPILWLGLLLIIGPGEVSSYIKSLL
jgi:hypothetical protein